MIQGMMVVRTSIVVVAVMVTMITKPTYSATYRLNVDRAARYIQGVRAAHG